MHTVSRLAHRGAQAVVAAGLVLAGLSLGTASAATNVITVNSAADTAAPGDHQCTLREAIANANSNSDTTSKDCKPGKPGMDVIAFKIAGPAPITIAVGSDLPAITDTLTIDGTTQPANKGPVAKTVCGTGANGTPAMSPRIEFDFTNGSGYGITTQADGVIIRGLSLVTPAAVGNDAIRITGGTGARVECNAIGVTTAGAASANVWQAGVGIAGTASGVTVGTNGDGINDANEGNAISGVMTGVDISSNTGTVVAGNTFGLGLDGLHTMAISAGVDFRQGSFNTRIGSNGDGRSDVLERNVFGNSRAGVLMHTQAATDSQSVVAGNWFAVDANAADAAGVIDADIDVQSGDKLRVGFDPSETNGAIIKEAQRNYFGGAGTGIRIEGGDQTLVAGNSLIGGMNALSFEAGTLNPNSSNNCFETNAFAVRNTTASTITLPGNYWGAADGPSGDGPGSGSAITNLGGGAIDVSGFATTSDDCRLVSAIVPAAPGPSILSPARGTSALKPIMLKWSKVPNATAYAAVFSLSPDFNGPGFSFNTAGPSGKSHPTPYGRVYWRVIAVVPLGISLPGETSYYDVTVMTAPKHLTTARSGKVKFSWTADKTIADSYRIDVDDDPAFGSVNYTQTGTGLSFTPTLASGTWYWRVTLIHSGIDQVSMPAWVVTVP